MLFFGIAQKLKILRDYYLFGYYNNMNHSVIKFPRTIVMFPGLVVLFCGCSPANAFINNPLKRIVVTRAIQSSVVEIITLNSFDQSAILQQFTCNCQENNFLGLYVLGSLYFGYNFWNNLQCDSKLSNIPTYTKSKRYMKHLLLMLFLILGKDIKNAI
jgi:hypothetical protein